MLLNTLLVPDPGTQASAGSAVVSDSTSVTISWTRGNGDGVIVVMKEGSTQTIQQMALHLQQVITGR